MQAPTAAGCTGREKINWSGSSICRDAAQLLHVTERETGAHPALQGWDGAAARGMEEITARLPLMQDSCEANAQKRRNKINYLI